jgi:hypothetical protein
LTVLSRIAHNTHDMPGQISQNALAEYVPDCRSPVEVTLGETAIHQYFERLLRVLAHSARAAFQD